MKAAVLRDFKEPLAIADVAQPTPAADEVLIAVEACGVCHSDLHLADGDWPQLVPITKRPLILGHEIAGRVVEKGASVNSLKLGDRVGVPWLHWSCGECEFCREDNENLCIKQKITGVTVDGGYAEFVKAPATHVVLIPDALSNPGRRSPVLRGRHRLPRFAARRDSARPTHRGLRRGRPRSPGGTNRQGHGSDRHRY